MGRGVRLGTADGSWLGPGGGVVGVGVGDGGRVALGEGRGDGDGSGWGAEDGAAVARVRVTSAGALDTSGDRVDVGSGDDEAVAVGRIAGPPPARSPTGGPPTSPNGARAGSARAYDAAEP